MKFYLMEDICSVDMVERYEHSTCILLLIELVIYVVLLEQDQQLEQWIKVTL